MRKISNKKILIKIKEWQNCPYIHQLTCSKNSLHPPLEAREINRKVILICPKCNYTQDHIPSTILNMDIKKYQKEMEKFFHNLEKE